MDYDSLSTVILLNMFTEQGFHYNIVVSVNIIYSKKINGIKKGINTTYKCIIFICL